MFRHQYCFWQSLLYLKLSVVGLLLGVSSSLCSRVSSSFSSSVNDSLFRLCGDLFWIFCLDRQCSCRDGSHHKLFFSSNKKRNILWYFLGQIRLDTLQCVKPRGRPWNSPLVSVLISWRWVESVGHWRQCRVSGWRLWPGYFPSLSQCRLWGTLCWEDGASASPPVCCMDWAYPRSG